MFLAKHTSRSMLLWRMRVKMTSFFNCSWLWWNLETGFFVFLFFPFLSNYVTFLPFDARLKRTSILVLFFFCSRITGIGAGTAHNSLPLPSTNPYKRIQVQIQVIQTHRYKPNTVRWPSLRSNKTTWFETNHGHAESQTHLMPSEPPALMLT